MRYSCPSCGAATVTQFLVQADRCDNCGAGLRAEDVEVEAAPAAERTTDPALLLLAEMVSVDPCQGGWESDACIYCGEWAAIGKEHSVDVHRPDCLWRRAAELLAALPPGTVPMYLMHDTHWHGPVWHDHGRAEVDHTHVDPYVQPPALREHRLTPATTKKAAPTPPR